MQTTVTSNRRLSGVSVARPKDTQRIPMFKITPVDGKKPSFMIVATKIRSRWPPRTEELPRVILSDQRPASDKKPAQHQWL